MSRPRPVELAVAFDDGSAVSTLINPQRDLDDARSAYGIAVDDVLLAPTLADAWAALAPLLDGCVPVGVGVDAASGLLDFELKRLGTVVPLPLGAEIPAGALTAEDRRGLAAPSALGRARAALRAAERAGVPASAGTPFDAAGPGEDGTYLLTRNPDAAPPSPAGLPTVTALLAASRVLSGVLLGDGPGPGRDGVGAVGPDPAVAAVVRDVVADRLTAAAERTTGLPADLVARLRVLEETLGIAVVDAVVGSAGDGRPAIGEVLRSGARVCFTGTAVDAAGRVWSRDEMTAAAVGRGLVCAAGVSRTRCDALVVAEVGTQSGKARKAKELGKPVYSAAEFFAWLAAEG
jgi:hypothetical protein